MQWTLEIVALGLCCGKPPCKWKKVMYQNECNGSLKQTGILTAFLPKPRMIFDLCIFSNRPCLPDDAISVMLKLVHANPDKWTCLRGQGCRMNGKLTHVETCNSGSLTGLRMLITGCTTHFMSILPVTLTRELLKIEKFCVKNPFKPGQRLD